MMVNIVMVPKLAMEEVNFIIFYNAKETALAVEIHALEEPALNAMKLVTIVLLQA
jgi:hypothetical protein